MAGGHYSKEELELYRHHQMSVLGRLACSAHLRECPECAKLLDELREDDRFLNDLRVSIRIYDTLSKGTPERREITM